MNSRLLLDAWGREVLAENGYIIADDAPVIFDLTTDVEGCCNECYRETPLLEIRSGSSTVTISYL